MYAVTFDIDQETLSKTYKNDSPQNAYNDIKKYMISHGFAWQQGSVYFGGDSMTAVKCVTTIQSMAKKYEWLSQSVRDIRMLRIEEDNDLLPAIELVS